MTSEPFETVIEIADYKELEKDKSLQFTVLYKTKDGEEILKIPGWRVKSKRVLIPSRFVQKVGWVPIVTASERFLALLELMVIPLSPSFTSVEFPSEVSETEQS